MRRAVVAVNAVHRVPWACNRSLGIGRDKLGHRSIAVRLAHPRNRLVRIVGCHILDVSQVCSVNSAQAAEPITSAYVQHSDSPRHGVRLIITIMRLHQHPVADLPLRIVAVQTGQARRRNLIARHNRCRNLIEQNHRKLLGAVHLGVNESRNSRRNVARRAGYVRVRRDVVVRELRAHHVAGLPAERRRIHIGDAAVGGGTDYDKVDERSDDHKHHTMPKDRVPQIDLGIDGRHSAGELELPLPQPHAHRNQHQAQDEQARQTQVDDDAQVGILRAAVSEDLDDPEPDQHQGGGAGERSADEADSVVAIEEEWANPILLEVLKVCHRPSVLPRASGGNRLLP